MVFVNTFEGEEIRQKVAHISEFSNSLGGLLGLMCDGFNEIQSDSVEKKAQLQEFVNQMEKQSVEISKLQEQHTSDENNKESHANLIAQLQQFILDFGDTSESLRSELSSLRVTTKNELYATQGAMEKLFTDAIAKLPMSGANSNITNKTVVFNTEEKGGNTPPEEYSQENALQVLADRLFALERKFSLSEATNLQLREQLNAQLQAQDKFDLLTTQVCIF